MDILEEIDETIKEKKEKWNYTPMREKNETDALIDELLKEFSAESEPQSSSYSESQPYNDYAGYNEKTEYEERMEYEQSDYSYNSQPVAEAEEPEQVNNPPRENVDMTQVFSREDIANYEVEHTANNMGYSEYNGSADDNYNGSGGFDDDYYDENDFDEDCGKLSSDDLDLDEEEYAELESFMENRSEYKAPIIKANPHPVKKVLQMVGTALVAAFTIIGIFSSGLYLFEKLESSTVVTEKKNDAIKEEMVSVVYPLVATGVDDFEKAEDISDEQIISASLWEIIINQNVKDFDDDGIIVPHEKIKLEAEKLFGAVEIESTDIEISGLEIKYDKDKKGYVMPENYNIYTLYPVVKNVSEADGVYTVSAECFADGPSWTADKKTMPVKKVIYTIKKTDTYYNVLSAKTAE